MPDGKCADRMAPYFPEPINMLPYMAKMILQIVIKLRALRWGDGSGLSRGAQYNHKGPYKKEVGD